MGCDADFAPSTIPLKISTHTSRVGCDYYESQFETTTTEISTHTSRVGCDETCFSPAFFAPISTHTSRVGCDHICHLFLQYSHISTHTSRVGCDWTTANTATARQ